MFRMHTEVFDLGCYLKLVLDDVHWNVYVGKITQLSSESRVEITLLLRACLGASARGSAE